MDKILNRICKIENHPISKLDKSLSLIYIKGLGAALYALAGNSAAARMIYNVWAQSIMGDSQKYDEVYWHEDPKSIKAALRLKVRGFKFISMSYEFIYDLFYLYASSLGDAVIYDDVYFFLKENCSSIWTKGKIESIFRYIIGEGSCPKKISPSQIEHWENNKKYLSEREFRILVVANMSAGKSTLINALTGYSINQTRNTACTDKIVYIHNKRAKEGATLRIGNGIYQYTDDIDSIDNSLFDGVCFPFKSTLGDYNIEIIDSPGNNNVQNIMHGEITEKVIKDGNYDAVMFVSNSQYFGTNDERHLLNILKSRVHKPIIFVLNQLDKFKQKEDSIEKMVGDYRSDLIKIGFRNPMVVPVSAAAALMFKTDERLLDEEDLMEKEIFEKKFQKEFYNLPSYVKDKSHLPDSNNLLEKTGIINLEKSIIELI